MTGSVRPSDRLSVRLSHPFHHVPIIVFQVSGFYFQQIHRYNRIIMKFSGVITMVKSDVHAKGQGQRSRSQRSTPNLAVSGL